MCKVKYFLLLFILGECCVSFSMAATEEGAKNANDLSFDQHLRTVQSRLNISSCVDRARKRVRNNDDRSLAILWINIYTQQCEYTDPDSKSKGIFFERLNKELRQPSGGPTSKLFSDSAMIINMAIDVLGPRVNSPLYRGNRYGSIEDFNHSPVTFKAFTSTSEICEVAMKFCCKDNHQGQFSKVMDGFGARISMHSASELEMEVLLKSNSRFKVETVETDEKKILERLADECNMEDVDEFKEEIIKKKRYGVPKSYVTLRYDQKSFVQHYKGTVSKQIPNRKRYKM